MQRNLHSFFNTAPLSDIELVNPATNTTYKCHKVVLAAGSDLFDQILQDNDPKLITKFVVPKHIATKSNFVDDPFPRVMEYIYGNQDFEKIKLDIDENNVCNVYSLAYSLRVTKLKSDLERHIVENFLNPENCCQFYLEAIRFESNFLLEKSRAMIVHKFEEIAETKNGTEFLNDLPFDMFLQLIEDTELNVTEEYQAVRAIDRYLSHRRALPPSPDDEDQKETQHLTEEEKKHREEVKLKTQEEGKKKQEEEKKVKDDTFAKLDALGKIQFTNDEKQTEKIKLIDEKLKVKKLKKEEKERLFKGIHYPFLKHEELIETSLNPNFDQAKDYIMQGLSYRLNPYEENQKYREFTINLQPRKNYGQDMERKIVDNFAKNRQLQHDQNIQNEKNMNQFAQNKVNMQQRLMSQTQQQQPLQQNNGVNGLNSAMNGLQIGNTNMGAVNGAQQNRLNDQQQQQQQFGNTMPVSQQQQQQQFNQYPPQQQQQQPQQNLGQIRQPQQQYIQQPPLNQNNYQQQQQPIQQQQNYIQQNTVPQSQLQQQSRVDQFNNQAKLSVQRQDQDSQNMGGVVAQSKLGGIANNQTGAQILDPHFSRQQQQIQNMSNPAMNVQDQRFLRGVSPMSQTQQMKSQNYNSPVQNQNTLASSMQNPLLQNQFYQPKAPQKEMFNIHAQTTLSPRRQNMSPYQAQIGKASSNHNDGMQSRGSNQHQQLIEFHYDHDFDENGALFYLGSYGLKRSWQNPHALGLIHCFASSIGGGKVEDIAGRQVVNCRTLNEPFSFFGIDLGEGRHLVPTCYSIRNRNSQTHVLMNWHFEASNDKINWIVLDRRIYLSDNQNYNQEMEQEQKQLQRKGATSTWGIDQQVYNEVGANGFRYFRIVQVGKNSSGSDNLTLSGFELYGTVAHNAIWEF
eukprot:403362705